MVYSAAVETLARPARAPALMAAYQGSHDEALNILMVEDVFSDALLTELALEGSRVPFSLYRLRRGDEVLSTLRLDRLCTPAAIPDVILLDLGLPGMNGFDILSELSEMSPAVRMIPIVILTAHQHFEYIAENYPLCIMAYINKPCRTEEMRDILLKVKNSRNLLRECDNRNRL